MIPIFLEHDITTERTEIKAADRPASKRCGPRVSGRCIRQFWNDISEQQTGSKATDGAHQSKPAGVRAYLQEQSRLQVYHHASGRDQFTVREGPTKPSAAFSCASRESGPLACCLRPRSISCWGLIRPHPCRVSKAECGGLANCSLWAVTPGISPLRVRKQGGGTIFLYTSGDFAH